MADIDILLPSNQLLTFLAFIMAYFKVLPLLTVLTLTACGNGDSYSDYLGYWESKEISQFTGTEVIQVAQVRKDGESYLFDGNILSNKSRPILLVKNEGKLSANAGLGNINLGLSDDKNTLYVANRTYTKIDESVANKYRQDKEDCKVLWQSYKDEIKEKGVHLAILDDEKTAIKKKIQKDYLPKFDKLQPECGMPFKKE